MKQSIYQKLFLNRSTKTILVSVTAVLWLLVTVAFSFAVFNLESKRINDQNVLRRKSIEETLVRVFEGYAKFGDLINSKGTVNEIGKPFGLSSFSLCKNKQSVPPKPFGDECLNLSEGYALNLNQENYEMFFSWDERFDYEIVRLFELLFFTCLISLVLVTLVTIVFLRVFKIRLFYVSNQISKVNSLEDLAQFKLDVSELRPITSSIQKLFEVVEKYSSEISRLKVEEFKSQMARQVAHDIRSPLSALQIAVTRLQNDTPEHELIVSASQRIRAIADDLLKKPSNTEQGQSLVAEEASFDLSMIQDQELIDLKQIVEVIVGEKKLSYSGQFILDFHEETNLKITGNKTEVERVVSNLLDNAIEALGNSSESEISVFLRIYGKSVSLSIADNGPGIPKNILAQLGQKGATFGKAGGSGLGLYGAKQYLEKLGGKLEIQSQEGSGTMVVVTVPRA
jgi:signal transduction histidine kinase